MLTFTLPPDTRKIVSCDCRLLFLKYINVCKGGQNTILSWGNSYPLLGGGDSKKVMGRMEGRHFFQIHQVQ